MGNKRPMPEEIVSKLRQVAHALELPGMGVSSHLKGPSRRKPGVTLAQIDPGFFRQAHQQHAPRS